MTRLRRLRQWSHRRPTLGGICLIVSAVLIGLPTLSGFRIGDMILSVSSISGVSTVWLSALMALCAVAVLFWRHTRVLAGISALVIAVVSFPAANFGGYLFGILGAAFTLAWRPLAERGAPGDDSDAGEDSDGDVGQEREP